MQRRMPFNERAPLLKPDQSAATTKERSERRSRGCMALVACCTCATMIALVFIVVALGIHARATAHRACTCAETIAIGATASPLATPPVQSSPACAATNVAYTFDIERAHCAPLANVRMFIAFAERRLAADANAPFEMINDCEFASVAVSNGNLVQYISFIGNEPFALFSVTTEALRRDVHASVTARIAFGQSVGPSLVSGEYIARTLLISYPHVNGGASLSLSDGSTSSSLAAINWTAVDAYIDSVNAATTTHHHQTGTRCEANYRAVTGAQINTSPFIPQCYDSCRCVQGSTIEIRQREPEILPPSPDIPCTSVRTRVIFDADFAASGCPVKTVDFSYVLKYSLGGPSVVMPAFNYTIIGNAVCTLNGFSNTFFCTAYMESNKNIEFLFIFERPPGVDDPNAPTSVDFDGTLRPLNTSTCTITGSLSQGGSAPTEVFQDCLPDPCVCDDSSVEISPLVVRVIPPKTGECAKVRVTALVGDRRSGGSECESVRYVFTIESSRFFNGQNILLDANSSSQTSDGGCAITNGGKTFDCTAQLANGNTVTFEVDFLAPNLVGIDPNSFVIIDTVLTSIDNSVCDLNRGLAAQRFFLAKDLQQCAPTSTLFGACRLETTHSENNRGCTCFDHGTRDDCFAINQTFADSSASASFDSIVFTPGASCSEVDTCFSNSYVNDVFWCMQVAFPDADPLVSGLEACTIVTNEFVRTAFLSVSTSPGRPAFILAGNQNDIYCDERTGACVNPSNSQP